MKLLLEMLSSLFYPSHKVFRLFHLHTFHLNRFASLLSLQLHHLHCQGLRIHLLILFFSCGAFFQMFHNRFLHPLHNQSHCHLSHLHHKCRQVFQHLLPCLHYRIVHIYLQSFDLHIAHTFLSLQLVR